MKKLSILLFVLFIVLSCGKDNIKDTPDASDEITASVPKIIHEFGYTLNDYKVIKDTIKKEKVLGLF